jgi:hypothetical protein
MEAATQKRTLTRVGSDETASMVTKARHEASRCGAGNDQRSNLPAPTSMSSCLQESSGPVMVAM